MTNNPAAQLKLHIQNYQFFGFVASLAYTCFAISICAYLSIISVFFPATYNIKDCNYHKLGSETAVKIHVDKMYYSGYDYSVRDDIKGHYYYTLENNTCTFFLINTNLVEDSYSPPATIEDTSFSAVISVDDSFYQPLIDNMAKDLDWNARSLSNYTNNYIVSQYNYRISLYIIIAALTLLGIAATTYFGVILSRKSK